MKRPRFFKKKDAVSGSQTWQGFTGPQGTDAPGEGDIAAMRHFGQFAVTDPKQARQLEAGFFHVRAQLVQETRGPEDWTPAFALDVHWRMFHQFFRLAAGILREGPVKLDGFEHVKLPSERELPQELYLWCKEAGELIRLAQSIDDPAEKMSVIFPKIATWHARAVVMQPAVDGNKRWARMTLDALLCDCGFRPGTMFDDRDRNRYLPAIIKAHFFQPQQLADMIARGWVNQRKLVQQERLRLTHNAPPEVFIEESRSLRVRARR